MAQNCYVLNPDEKKSLVFWFFKALSPWESTTASSSQLLVPHCVPLLVFIHFQFEFVGCDHSVLVSVLVFEHVGDDLLHGQAGLRATFPLGHLQLDELPELKTWREIKEWVCRAVQELKQNQFQHSRFTHLQCSAQEMNWFTWDHIWPSFIKRKNVFFLSGSLESLLWSFLSYHDIISSWGLLSWAC